jgi:hypothetical protein
VSGMVQERVPTILIRQFISKYFVGLLIETFVDDRQYSKYVFASEWMFSIQGRASGRFDTRENSFTLRKV